MTEAELNAMEHRDTLTQKFDAIRTIQERSALLHEVRRLRELVKDAFEEGQSATDRDGDQLYEWAESDAYKALDKATP